MGHMRLGLCICVLYALGCFVAMPKNEANAVTTDASGVSGLGESENKLFSLKCSTWELPVCAVTESDQASAVAGAMKASSNLSCGELNATLDSSVPDMGSHTFLMASWAVAQTQQDQKAFQEDLEGLKRALKTVNDTLVRISDGKYFMSNFLYCSSAPIHEDVDQVQQLERLLNASTSHKFQMNGSAPYGVSITEVGGSHSIQGIEGTASLNASTCLAAVQSVLARWLGGIMGIRAFLVVFAVVLLWRRYKSAKQCKSANQRDCTIHLMPHIDSSAAEEHFKREFSWRLQVRGYSVDWECESVPQLRIFLHHTEEGRIDFQECHEAILAYDTCATLFKDCSLNCCCSEAPLIAVFVMLHNPDLPGTPPVAMCKGDAEAYRHLRASVTSCNEWYYFPGPGNLGRHNKELYSQIVSVLDGIR